MIFNVYQIGAIGISVFLSCLCVLVPINLYPLLLQEIYNRLLGSIATHCGSNSTTSSSALIPNLQELHSVNFMFPIFILNRSPHPHHQHPSATLIASTEREFGSSTGTLAFSTTLSYNSLLLPDRWIGLNLNDRVLLLIL